MPATVESVEPRPEPIVNIAMVLMPDFNAMATQAFLDPFRAANYVQGKTLYRWVFHSLTGGVVTASSGLSVTSTVPIQKSPGHPDMIVVNSSWAPERFRDRRLKAWLSEHERRGCVLVGLDTGAFVLAFAGLMKGYEATVHYEHTEAFRELFPDAPADQRLFVIDRNRLTCCGGLASADLALELIRHRHGLDLANAAARYIFVERLRDGSEGQLSGTHEPVGYTVPEPMREAILMMERNLEEPLRIPELSAHLQTSQRQLERLFSKYAGASPARYYLNLRLDRARGLITQTQMTVVEIAGACGFSGAEPMTRAYKHRFGITPSRDRVEGRIPFQFRAFPQYAGV